MLNDSYSIGPFALFLFLFLNCCKKNTRLLLFTIYFQITFIAAAAVVHSIALAEGADGVL